MIATCRIKLKKQSFTSQPNSRFDVSKLRIPDVEYQVAIQNHFTALADGTGEWDTFKDAHTIVAEEVLGFRRYVRHEWISDQTWNLVEKKHTVRLNHDMDQYKDLNRQCKKSARQDKQNWAESKAIQGEAYLATGQIKDAFAHFRNLRSACPQKVSPILDDHGNLISDKSSQSSQVEESL